jgi:capsular polysaccharide transport system ATP-binding protein
MIHLERVTSAWHSATASVTVLDDVTIKLPTSERFAVLGRERSGKTTLIRLLSGLILPTSGVITRYARVSFPAGYMGGYRNAISVRENIAHVARLYGAKVNQVVEFVCELTALGYALREPYGNLPQLYRRRLAYAVSYAIPFDDYLIDTRIAAGGSEFRQRCEQIFEAHKAAGLYLLQIYRVTLRDLQIKERYYIMVRLSCITIWKERFGILIGLETPWPRWGWGCECRTSCADFQGRPLQTHARHQRPSGEARK